MREIIRNELRSIVPLDDFDRSVIDETVNWVDSGAELFRISKPDNPPKHLVSYCVVLDGEHVLLVDHRLAGLWLPTGGHVEPGEHPRETARREAHEELGVSGNFLSPNPLMVSQTVTVGQTAGHTDVSLWYAIQGNRRASIWFDSNEFHDARWFHHEEVSDLDRDPFMDRFLERAARLTGVGTQVS